MFRQRGADYFNPDEAARAIRQAHPGWSQTQANSAAWQQGKRLLEEAIAKRLDFAMETTLGGRSIVGLLHDAAALGFEVRVWFVALDSPQAHIDRVRSRVGEVLADAFLLRVRLTIRWASSGPCACWPR